MVRQTAVSPFNKHSVVFEFIVVTFVAFRTSIGMETTDGMDGIKTDGADITGVETLTAL